MDGHKLSDTNDCDSKYYGFKDILAGEEWVTGTIAQVGSDLWIHLDIAGSRLLKMVPLMTFLSCEHHKGVHSSQRSISNT